jgi:hypothetical protein
MSLTLLSTGASVVDVAAAAAYANSAFLKANSAIQNSTSLSFTNVTISGNSVLQQSQENFQTKAGASGATTYDFSTGGTFYHTGVTSAIQATLINLDNTAGRVSVFCCPIVQGGTAYIINSLTVNGSTPTIKWSGGTTPTGNANKFDVITFSIFNVSGTYTVLGALASYG